MNHDVLTGSEAELAVFGVRLPDPDTLLDTDPTPFVEFLERARREDRDQEAS